MMRRRAVAPAACCGAFSKAMRHRCKIGMVLLVGGLAVWVLSGALGISSILVARSETGVLPASMGWAMLLAYVGLLAIPFAPSAEIGLAVMVTFGASMALPVYAATLLGLTIAFAAGRYVDRYGRSHPMGRALKSTDALVVPLQGIQERSVLQRILRFRWLAVIVMINMPGNTVLGGGGGIAMAVGYSRTFTFPGFLMCVAIAVAPVPTLLLVTGADGVEKWLYVWLGQVH